jgi:hypothetical protein
MRAQDHIRSMPSIITRRIANIAIPIATATTSMGALSPVGHHEGMTIHARI